MRRKSLIRKRFELDSRFLWITLLIPVARLGWEPEKSRLWLDCPEKGQRRKAFQIKHLRALLVL
jgi:hypothetical protein